ISLSMNGSGSLTLRGANTYAGSTAVNSGNLALFGTLGNGAVTVNAGTLSGAGTLAGPVTVQAAGTIAPGDNGIGTLTISNALNLGGTTAVRLKKSGFSRTNDAIIGMSSLALGGTLQVANLADSLTVGDTFKLFSSSSYSGSFASVVPGSPGP